MRPTDGFQHHLPFEVRVAFMHNTRFVLIPFILSALVLLSIDYVLISALLLQLSLAAFNYFTLWRADQYAALRTAVAAAGARMCTRGRARLF